MVIADQKSLPVAVYVGGASPSENTLVEATLNASYTKTTPALLVGDKAYDSDPLDKYLREMYGVSLIAPHKANRVKPKTQDGRQFRR